MHNYQVPLRDIEFTAKEMFGFIEHYRGLTGVEELSEDMLSAILQEAAKFCESKLVPINHAGDQVGCRWVDGQVITPPGYKDAFNAFAEGGWVSLAEEPKRGGQGLPFSLFMLVFEMLASSNMAFSLYIANYYGTLVTLGKYGTEQQKSTFMTKLISAEWNSTMCLTEPHCGSDLGLLRTKAVSNDDGSYSLNGTKIFITSGEHDLNENIIHLALARLPDAPAGTKGISLFIVPKFHVEPDGSLGERNKVHCLGIEEKMGIHGSATCTMQFDGATGYLLGEKHNGLKAMFTYMNESRVTTAIQAYAVGEASFQGALQYAKERLQMRAAQRTHPELPADPIVSHPDVRRMLFTQKALTEGGRMLSYYCLKQMDLTLKSTDQSAKDKAENLLALLTPIAKGFNSEVGIEATSLGIQTFGGHGFIAESGMEQLSRDQRITAIYEGVTAIQGLDLLGRKALAMGLLEEFLPEVLAFISNNQADEMLEFIRPLQVAVSEWQEITSDIRERAQCDVNLVGACAYDFLMYSGYATLAYFWAQAAEVALLNISAGNQDSFYQGKLDTARFYFSRLLPRSQSYLACLRQNSSNLMATESQNFLFL
ncbi:MAG: acyl-CoA dehydrogenase C-terminal domain-containing protein [Pseudomonadales bacterium]